MSPKKENRFEHRRGGCDAEMEWTYFNRQEGVEGRLLNASRSGGCIESPREVRVPSTVLLRLKRCNAMAGEAQARVGVRSATLADVKWCRPLSGGEKPLYAIGVKYIDGY
jgi:hypothetical protein